MFFLYAFSCIKGSQDVPRQTVTAGMLKEWVSYLASDQMEGRRNGSQEMKAASGWIAEKFRENDIKPLGQSGSYIQDYTYLSRQNLVNERNVLGFIEGSDPLLKNEFIVLSAHFDHIGIRRNSTADSICNGADDNAAGTCTLLGIAKAIKESHIKPGRSIVFAAFSGEEHGMKGSEYFVANSPIPVKDIYVDLNFEMTGHSELLGRRNYYMTGCDKSNLDDLIKDYNINTGFTLVDTLAIGDMLFGSSDNISFSGISTENGITRGIPSGTFATSAISDYLHTVNDEIELFDFENMADIVNYFGNLVLWLSENKSIINWTDPKFSKP